MGDIEALDAFGRLRQPKRRFKRLCHGFGGGLEHPESLHKRVASIFLDEFEKGMLFAALRVEQFNAMTGPLAEYVFEKLPFFEVHRRVNVARHIGCIEIKLLNERGQKLRRIEFFEILPIKVAAIDHAPAAQVK